jgi:hypothetical protein
MAALAPARRDPIVAAAAAPLVTVAPAVQDLPQVWEQAKAAYLAARNQEDIFDQTIARPASRCAQAGGLEYDEALTDASDRLCDIRCAAETRLICTPAPDLAAVIWKIEHARERWKLFEEWADGWWDAVMADLHRLEGGLHARSY